MYLSIPRLGLLIDQSGSSKAIAQSIIDREGEPGRDRGLVELMKGLREQWSLAARSDSLTAPARTQKLGLKFHTAAQHGDGEI